MTQDENDFSDLTFIQREELNKNWQNINLEIIWSKRVIIILIGQKTKQKQFSIWFFKIEKWFHRTNLWNKLNWQNINLQMILRKKVIIPLIGQKIEQKQFSFWFFII